MNPWEKPGMTVEERAAALAETYADEHDRDGGGHYEGCAVTWGRMEHDLRERFTSALRAAVRDAVEAEREACARTVEKTRIVDSIGIYGAGWNDSASNSAIDIRARNRGGK